MLQEPAIDERLREVRAVVTIAEKQPSKSLIWVTAAMLQEPCRAWVRSARRKSRWLFLSEERAAAQRVRTTTVVPRCACETNAIDERLREVRAVVTIAKPQTDYYFTFILEVSI